MKKGGTVFMTIHIKVTDPEDAGRMTELVRSELNGLTTNVEAMKKDRRATFDITAVTETPIQETR